jgi:hypothetical protein
MEAWLRLGSAASRSRAEKVSIVVGNAVAHVGRVVADGCMWAAVFVGVAVVFSLAVLVGWGEQKRAHLWPRRLQSGKHYFSAW